MTKAGNQWPQEIRDQALDVYRADGLERAAEITGVPKRTITYWANKALVVPMKAQFQPWVRRRQEVAKDLAEAAVLLARRFKAEAPTATPTNLRNLSVALAIAIDKNQLLAGDATGRVSVQDGGQDEQLDRDIERLLAQSAANVRELLLAEGDPFNRLDKAERASAFVVDVADQVQRELPAAPTPPTQAPGFAPVAPSLTGEGTGRPGGPQIPESPAPFRGEPRSGLSPDGPAPT